MSSGAGSSAGASSPPAGATDGAGPSPEPVVVTELGKPLWGATGTWQLVVRTRDSLVRIEPARGRVTRTALPDPGEEAMATLVVGRDRVLVFSPTGTSAALVVDGRPATEWSGRPDNDSTALPGPDPEHFWMVSYPGAESLREVGLDGGEQVAAITLPVDLQGTAVLPDQAGGLLVSGVGGVYQVRTSGLRRVTTGTVLAAGPTRLLVRECDATYRCTTLVVDRATGSRRALPTAELSGTHLQGVVSPDGSKALTTRAVAAGTWAPVMVDLREGAAVDADGWGLVTDSVANAAWSPDSRWLFAVVAPSLLVAVDTRTGAIADLGVPLPDVLQVAVRP